MPRQATDLEKKLKTFELSKEVRSHLDDEPHGNQRLIVENLLRQYYDLPSVALDQIRDSRLE